MSAAEEFEGKADLVRFIDVGGGTIADFISDYGWYAAQREINVTLIGDSSLPSPIFPNNPFMFRVICIFPDRQNMERFAREVYPSYFRQAPIPWGVSPIPD